MANKKGKITYPETLRKVKKIIGIFSAKGGVGKSVVALNLALSLRNKDKKVGLVDADIYGPSQALMLGAKGRKLEVIDEKLIVPLKHEGLKFMSMGLIAADKVPVIWRGPMVSGAVLQLLSQTDWQELDYLIVDTPPGTGDAQLTLLQQIPLSAAVVITIPNEVSLSDTRKGIEMINKLKIPILGLVENMSWYTPLGSTKKHYVFGKDGGVKLATEYNLDLLAQIPLVDTKDDDFLIDNAILSTIFNSLASEVVDKSKNIDGKYQNLIPQVNLKTDA